MSFGRAALIAWVLVSGCGASRSDTRARTERGARVALVDGEAVYADEVALVARRARVAPREALERVIRERLLVAEGRRRGLIGAAHERDAAWHARLQLLLEREVEARYNPATIAQDFFRALYERRRVELSHDGLVEVVHVVAVLRGDAGVGTLPAARALAERFYASVTAQRGAPTRAQFEAAARAHPGLRFEALPAFDRTGQSADGNRFVEPFARAAWALTEAEPLSNVVETSFGAHVMLRVGAVPPLRRPDVDVRGIIVRDGVAMQRTRALTTLVEAIRSRVDVRVSEAALGAAPRVEVSETAPALRP